MKTFVRKANGHRIRRYRRLLQKRLTHIEHRFVSVQSRHREISEMMSEMALLRRTIREWQASMDYTKPLPPV
jgi:hypothetical protein